MATVKDLLAQAEAQMQALQQTIHECNAQALADAGDAPTRHDYLLVSRLTRAEASAMDLSGWLGLAQGRLSIKKRSLAEIR